MKPLTPEMATGLHQLVATIDLNAEQVQGQEWPGAVCLARDALPEGTMAALEQLSSGNELTKAMVKNCAVLLYLATNCVERNFTDEALLHMGKLSSNLDKLKAMLETCSKGI